MEWLANNWIWLAVGLGALFLLTQRGGCGMSHGGNHRNRQADRSGANSGPSSTTTVARFPSGQAGSDDRARPSTGHTHAVPPVNEGARADEHAGHGRQHRHGC